MNRGAFENYLNNYIKSNGQHLTEKSIVTIIRDAEKAEDVLGHSFDFSVATDTQMKNDLIVLRINNAFEQRYGGMQKALRKYYQMIHGRQFPRLKDV